MLSGSHKLLILVLLYTLHLNSLNGTLDSDKTSFRTSLVEPVFSYDDYGIQHEPASKTKQLQQPGAAVVVLQQPEAKGVDGPHKIKSVVLSSSPYTSSSLYRSPFALLNLSEEPLQLQPKRDEPHHWSALENYYQKLRSSQPSTTLRAPFEQYSIEPTILDYYNYRQQPIDVEQRDRQPFRLLAPGSYYPPLKVVSTTNQKQLLLPPLVDPELERITQQQLLTTQELFFPPQQQQQLQPHQKQQHLLTAGHDDYPSSYNQHQLAWTDLVQRPIDKLLIEDGRAESWWRRRLPELLQLRQLQEQQLRAKHQLATFGNWYDYQRNRELLQDEAYCGPRNYVGVHSTSRQTNVDSPADYPSHVGIYNNTSYLCAGSWVSESFVLTVASCVSDIEPNHLQIRFNEWNAHHHQDPNVTQMWASLPLPKPMPVDQVHLFPKYRDTREHNLALLRLATPVDYLSSAYVVPACQAQARSLLRASNCWAPVRNITRVEYFDPTGDGETREKLVTTMLEKPVKLVVRDEQECKRSTGSELFNFQHPNFICSADLKRNEWRLKLNTTDAYGSGIYCEEGGRLTLVSLLHPVRVDQPSSSGYLDLTYYRPWMRNIMQNHGYL